MVWLLAFLWSYMIAVSCLRRVSPVLFMCYYAFSDPGFQEFVIKFLLLTPLNRRDFRYLIVRLPLSFWHQRFGQPGAGKALAVSPESVDGSL